MSFQVFADSMQQLKLIVIQPMAEEDGLWYRGDKMDLLTLTGPGLDGFGNVTGEF